MEADLHAHKPVLVSVCTLLDFTDLLRAFQAEARSLAGPGGVHYSGDCHSGILSVRLGTTGRDLSTRLVRRAGGGALSDSGLVANSRVAG